MTETIKKLFLNGNEPSSYKRSKLRQSFVAEICRPKFAKRVAVTIFPFSAPAHPLSPQKISQSEEGGPINLFRMTKVASIADRSVAPSLDGSIDRLQSGPVTSRKSFRNWDGRALALWTCGDQSSIGLMYLEE